MPRFPQDVRVYGTFVISSQLAFVDAPSQVTNSLYHRDGIRIGDSSVGIPEDGCFDVFNTCLPQDHPFHRATGVPDDFKPVELSGMDIRTVVNAENGRIIANSVKSFTVHVFIMHSVGTSEIQCITRCSSAHSKSSRRKF